MLPEYQKKVTVGLKKAQGQLNHALKLIGEDAYCLEVAQQINAAVGLLQQSSNLILESHLLSCGSHKLVTKNLAERKKFVQELIRIFSVTKRKS